MEVKRKTQDTTKQPEQPTIIIKTLPDKPESKARKDTPELNYNLMDKASKESDDEDKKGKKDGKTESLTQENDTDRESGEDQTQTSEKDETQISEEE